MKKKIIQRVFQKYFIDNIDKLDNNETSTNKSKKYIFRGIPCAGKIESSASYRLRNESLLKQTDFIRYHIDLIQDKQFMHQSSKSNLPDIETLAEIQHHGGATCLIDFSYNYLIALYFSSQETQCESLEDSKNGKVFAIDLYNPTNEKIHPLNKKYKNESIENILQKRERYNNSFMPRVWIWRPYDLNNRILKQDSVFLFSLEKIDKDTNLIFEEFLISNKDKRFIREILDKYFNINPETVFHDLPGFSLANNRKSKINNFNLKPDTCFHIGRDLYRQEDLFSSEMILNSIINCLSKEGKKCDLSSNTHEDSNCINNKNSTLLETYYFKGLIAKKNNNLHLSLNCFNKALEYYNNFDNPSKSAIEREKDIRIHILIILYKLEEYKIAIEFCEKTLQDSKYKNNTVWVLSLIELSIISNNNKIYYTNMESVYNKLISGDTKKAINLILLYNLFYIFNPNKNHNEDKIQIIHYNNNDDFTYDSSIEWNYNTLFDFIKSINENHPFWTEEIKNHLLLSIRACEEEDRLALEKYLLSRAFFYNSNQ